jgi:hypothetical protein
MVDKTVVLENRRGIMECKRKMQHTRAHRSKRFHECDRTPLKKQGFVSQDPTRGFSMKRECANTHISIQYYDIQVIKQLLHIKCHAL